MKKLLFLLSFLSMMLLNSCQGPSAHQSDPDAPVMLISTLDALGTPVSIFEYPDQVSDGKLLFSIEEVDNTCHDISRPIELKLIFYNLTDQAINLIKEFSVSAARHGAGNLSPLLTTRNGESVLTYADVSMFDTFNSPTNDFIEISAKESFVYIVEYRFPKMFVESITSKDPIYFTPSPGNYFLRFVYLQYQRDIEAWYGAISSNQIEICVNN